MSEAPAARCRVLIATGNSGKLAEIRSILAELPIEFLGLEGEPAVSFPDEGDDYAGNARAKALAVVRQRGVAAVADDSGLEVDALRGAPGPRSARFGGPDLDDRGRVQKLLEALAATPDSQRGARFVCAAALAVPGEESVVCWGECKGTILPGPRGRAGFGYDPVFQPEGYDRSLAELYAPEKRSLSHRGHAFRSLLIEIERRLVETG